MTTNRIQPLCLAALGLLACSNTPTTSQLTVAQLEDPVSCQNCHPTQFSDWQGSMHAYASEDPVFLAMNARGQRETDGGLGPFCIQCHAPMAVQTGLSTDGLNLAAVPQEFHGVTCFFCHSVAEVAVAHDGGFNDNPLVLSYDGGLRGSIRPPDPALISSMPHGGTYSPLLDSSVVTSATMCGACHDIVNGHGTAIERTFAEWEASAFSQDTTGGESCNQCHMPQSTSPGPITTLPGAPNRELHAHLFPAIDSALTSFANAPAQQQAVQQFLDTSLASAVCVDQTLGGYQIQVYLDNVSAGHMWPSGAAQDRRPWVQVIATDADGGVIYSSGMVDAGTSPTDVGNDPDRWMLRDCMFGGADGGEQVDMFWEALSFEGNALSPSVTFDPTNLLFYVSHVVQTYPRTTSLGVAPAQVTMQVYFQPIGLDVLNDLIDGGYLEASVVQAMPTLTVGPQIVWTPSAAQGPDGSTFADPNSNQLAQCVSNQGYNTASNIYTTAQKAVAKANCFP